eukprot:gnl/MRDRNA2_/MRDRNA2_105394_c0_seq1.p1 gnl/MRDRNA2_/MRDRNA2_105394_c0~~gnl/MRDRNA2_/MRDRNA2_105394_c0_seq1.p1  ORF type:complete len:183 (+),score=19.36 gnl/MRDRNA2_/MRDRNA2_105394_c0_seq1:187-735(+)
MVNTSNQNSKSFERLSQKKEMPKWSFSKTERSFAGGGTTSGPKIGPGHYRSATSFFRGQQEEFDGRRTQTAVPQWKFSEYQLLKQGHRDCCGTYLGHEMWAMHRPTDGPTRSQMGRKTDLPSPLVYNTMARTLSPGDMNPLNGVKHVNPVWSFPRRRRQPTDVSSTPGPGAYTDHRGSFGKL